MAADPYDDFLRGIENLPRFLYYEVPIVAFALGTILNLILLTYLIKAKRYRSPLFMLITSLCVSDLVMCVSTLLWPIFIFPTMDIPGTGFLCSVVLYLWFGTISVSTYHLVFFSMMRFYQLCYPLQARSRVTVKLVLRACIWIWIIWYASQIPMGLLFTKTLVRYRESSVYICAFQGDTRAKDIFYSAACLLIPFIMICFFHVYKHLKVSEVKHDIGQARRNTDARAVTIVLVLSFAVWAPTFFHDGAHDFFNAPEYSFHYIMYITQSYFDSANSVLNPLVYSLASKTIRNDILKTFFPGKRDP